MVNRRNTAINALPVWANETVCCVVATCGLCPIQAKLMTYATDKLDTPSLHFVPIVNLTHGSGKYTFVAGAGTWRMCPAGLRRQLRPQRLELGRSVGGRGTDCRGGAAMCNGFAVVAHREDERVSAPSWHTLQPHACRQLDPPPEESTGGARHRGPPTWDSTESVPLLVCQQ